MPGLEVRLVLGVFWVAGLGFRVWGLGFRVRGLQALLADVRTARSTSGFPRRKPFKQGSPA